MSADPDGQIDERAMEPLYIQLAGILRARIARGDFRGRLPSESQLHEAYGLSRPTIRHAISVLAGEGLVITIPQRGTFIVEPDEA